MKDNIKVIIPEDYPYKVTSRDKKQYIREMNKCIEQLELDKNISKQGKKEMLDTISELFWKAKILNKRKFAHKNNSKL
ncbi:hypothetical protein ACFHWD_14370 [Clostridium sp. MT-14]|uniref:hypothetical protein n=1 Tax=Clostridium sp. MT-14 TaxID=3348360 RepID=UPI0035F390E7